MFRNGGCPQIKKTIVLTQKSGGPLHFFDLFKKITCLQIFRCTFKKTKEKTPPEVTEVITFVT